MAAKVNRKTCMHCGGCVGVCPVNAITLDEGILRIDEERCINCGTCVKFCPMRALKIEK